MTGSCEYSNKPLGSLKAGNVFISWVIVSFSRASLCGVSYIC